MLLCKTSPIEDALTETFGKLTQHSPDSIAKNNPQE